MLLLENIKVKIITEINLSWKTLFSSSDALWQLRRWSRAGPLWWFRDTVVGIWYGGFTSSSWGLQSSYRPTPEDGWPANATERQSHQFHGLSQGFWPCRSHVWSCVFIVDDGGAQGSGSAEVRSSLAGAPAVSNNAAAGHQRPAVVQSPAAA